MAAIFRKYMKKGYIKPYVCVESFEVKSNFLGESNIGYGGDSGEDGPKESDVRGRYGYGATDNGNGRRNYGSYGSRNTGWGSLW